jgi:hypothetical protein
LEHAEDLVRLLGIWWARIMIFRFGGGSFFSFFPSFLLSPRDTINMLEVGNQPK